MGWGDVIELADGKAEVVVRGKGGKTRAAGMSGKAYSIVRALMLEDSKTADYIFTKQNGEAYDRLAIHYVFRKASKLVGKTISPHWMRHNHVTHALDNGTMVMMTQFLSYLQQKQRSADP